MNKDSLINRNMSEDKLRIDKIKKGTVIDHITEA